MATSKPASVQIQTTIIDEHGATMCDASDVAATHWSVYLRGEDGLANHFDDFALKMDSKLSDNRGLAKTAALCAAARLSMEFQIPIEPIR